VVNAARVGQTHVLDGRPMAPVLPKSYQAAYVIVWRFFTLIINMIIAAGVVMSYLSGKRSRQSMEAMNEPVDADGRTR
jgi:hypothetical protein